MAKEERHVGFILFALPLFVGSRIRYNSVHGDTVAVQSPEFLEIEVYQLKLTLHQEVLSITTHASHMYLY